MALRAFARQLFTVSVGMSAGAMLLSTSALAQQAAQPAQELPPVEVVAKKKAAPAKKKQVTKQAPVKQKAAPVVQVAAPPTEAPAPDTSSLPGNPGSATAPVENYAATSSATGTKTGTPLKETPQSISVVGKEQMRDQGVQNLQEALRYMPGVIADGFGYDSRGDYSVVRGISDAYFLDGLRTTYGFYANSISIEPYGLERAEVLRGPSSMLYGQVPTGGFVNGISKLPQATPYTEVGVDYGSFDFKQFKFDTTGPLTSDGKWLYRVVGLARDAETQVDYVDNDRLFLAPSLTYRPTSDTSITLLGSFRDDHTGSTQQFLPQIGTLTPNVNGQRIKHSTFIGEPDDYYDTKQQAGTLLVNHKFNDALEVRNATRYAYTENDYRSTYAAVLTPTRSNALFGTTLGTEPFFDADQSLIARSITVQENETTVFNTDTSVTAKLRTGPLAHKLTGGVDYMHYQTDLSFAGVLIDNIPFLTQPAFNIYNPQYGQSTFLYALGAANPIVDPSNIPLYARPTETQEQLGLYVQDEIKLGRWGLVLGLRQDWVKFGAQGESAQRDQSLTGRAALLYNFDFGLTPYISYSQSFLTLPGNQVGDNIFVDPLLETRPAAPSEGEQVEIGFKYQPNGAPYMFNAAVFDMTDSNRVVQPDFLFQPVQGAAYNVRGFEAEFVGKVYDGLKIAAAYTYLDATYSEYPELNPLYAGISAYMEGKPVDSVPKHMASLWAIYTLESGHFKGLSFGAGVRYVGEAESYGREIAFPEQEIYVRTPSYTLFDAMVAYETPDWRWQVTAQNLENEFYVTSCSAYRGDCGVGQARTVITGFTYKF